MFIRYPENPVIPKKPGTFRSLHVANPDILEFNGKIFLYYRGQGAEKHDQIGVAFVETGDFDGINWIFHQKNPVVKVSSETAGFDARHILDPAAVEINGKVYLYYSGHSYDKPSCIGLAVSKDGFTFAKIKKNPVIENAIAPEVILKDGVVYLFYQRKNSRGHFEFYCCTSCDGKNFNYKDERIVLMPSFEKGTFDEYSITTGRIWRENNVYYMTYGGCSEFADYPSALGLAKSEDLINWSRYPGNPIFMRGEAGEWDEGALWFGTVYKYNDYYYMWYEGTGAGMGTETTEAANASAICRNEDYGGYAKINFSQIGLATFNGELPDW